MSLKLQLLKSIMDQARKGISPTHMPVIQKATELLSYHPSFTLEKGLEQSVQW